MCLVNSLLYVLVLMPGNICLVTTAQCAMCCAAMRIMDVRAAYCVEDFEWEMCRKIARQDMKDANVNLMRQYADIAFAKKVDGNNEAHLSK